MAQEPWPCALPTTTFSGSAGNSDARFKSRLVDEGGSVLSAAQRWPCRHRGTLRLESEEPSCSCACVNTFAGRGPQGSGPFPDPFRKLRVKRPAQQPLGDISLHPDPGGWQTEQWVAVSVSPLAATGHLARARHGSRRDRGVKAQPRRPAEGVKPGSGPSPAGASARGASPRLGPLTCERRRMVPTSG